jgi:hypothetical protein
MRLVAGHLSFFVLLAATLCGSAQAMDYAHSPRLRHPIPGRTLRRPVLGRRASGPRRRQCRRSERHCLRTRSVAYLRGSHVGMARKGDNVFDIVPILVVGIDTATGSQAGRLVGSGFTQMVVFYAARPLLLRE